MESLQRTAKAIWRVSIRCDRARSLAGDIAETDKIQSLAKEPVAPSRVGRANCSPVPEQSAATARIGFANRVPAAARQLCTINCLPHRVRYFFARIMASILGEKFLQIPASFGSVIGLRPSAPHARSAYRKRTYFARLNGRVSAGGNVETGGFGLVEGGGRLGCCR